MKRNTIKDLIKRANKIHNNKYDYSLITEYKRMHDHQKIICKVHGITEEVSSTLPPSN